MNILKISTRTVIPTSLILSDKSIVGFYLKISTRTVIIS